MLDFIFETLNIVTLDDFLVLSTIVTMVSASIVMIIIPFIID